MAIGNGQPAVVNGAAITAQGISTALNITTATLVKAGQGRVAKAMINTAGSTAGGIYDSATVGGVSASNLIAVLPNTVGMYTVDFPVKNGLVVSTGTGQVVSVSYI
jgi:hypothetical protein